MGTADHSNTILVVDDEPEIVSVITDILNFAVYRVLAATTAAEALDLAGRECPDLILLDALLPDMRSSEFTAIYRQQTPPEQQAAIVIVTAHADINRFAREADAHGSIAKPFDIDTLTNCIEQVLRQYRHAA